ncbi:MAG: tRNA (adenosine(37)-N6)-threonylcarbamoyltransferase complex dimerization subunit type 1 TsaB [Ideonella sp.]|nr:tRNA (adenosine(37)-N6)-threonylcarbamoyltransferase complex dimerization subunit type 1 TsaB [Ideonella sp.]
MQPCLLAIDTSTERMALALCWPGADLTRVEAGGAASSARLLPLAQELLHQAGLGFAQLDAIAFGVGPGAFTGLRTACAVAQGLAFAHGRPVLPLDSLMLVAQDAAGQGLPASRGDGPIWVAMDARMDEAYAAAYRRVAGRWCVVEPPALYTLPALAVRWAANPPEMVAGSAIEAFAERLPFGPARLVPRERDRGAALAVLCRQAWALGQGVAADQALPLYLRDKVALTTDERARAAAAKA